MRMLQPVGGVTHVRIIHPLQALRTDPTVMTYFAASGEIKTPWSGTEMPRILVLHRPRLTGEAGAASIRGMLVRGLGGS